MIRIFVPILILSTISLLIFVQENATDGNGFTTLAKRIASGCSLMIAYVALVPMIRSNLPPTPSVTLVEILIYASTIPNFLAIISNLFTHFIDYNDFFSNYTPFSDGLFISSFVISVVSFIILTIVMAAFSRKTYQADYTIPKLPSATVENVLSPFFIPYINKTLENRKDYKIKQLDKKWLDIQFL